MARYKAFTLIEVIVVISIIALLIAIMMPALKRARDVANSTACTSNLRQIFLVLNSYAAQNNEYFPLEPTEHNPHLTLVENLELVSPGVVDAMYCPQSDYMEKYAQDPVQYIPTNSVDSVIPTPANKTAGNIGYVYWSFEENKVDGSGPWRNPAFFLPRALTVDRAITVDPARPAARVSPGERWVITDFFRRGAPFPHDRGHAQGLNIAYQDGHVILQTGKPKLNYR